MEEMKASKMKEFEKCPRCEESNEGAVIFYCRACKNFFCEFCDFESIGEMRCPCKSRSVRKVGVIAKPKKAEESKSSDPPWTKYIRNTNFLPLAYLSCTRY